MKTGIHPKYHQATVICSCGHTYTVGSTVEKIETELCSQCHPFYTGQQKLVDTAGRVERFRQQQKKAKGGATKGKKKSGKDLEQQAGDDVVAVEAETAPTTESAEQ